MLKSFTVKSFRNLANESLKFNRNNIMLGPNNSGKSNLIKAISYFSDMILSESRVGAFHSELEKNGWDDIFNRNEETPGTINMEWVINTGSQYPDLTYYLSFRVGAAEQIPKGFYILDEQVRYASPKKGQSRPFEFVKCHGNTPGKGSFSVKDSQGKTKNVILDVDQNETVFRQIPKLLDSDKFRVEFYPNFNEIVKSVKDFFEGFLSFSSTEFDIKGLKEPTKIDLSCRFLNKTGSNFVNVLNYLDQKYDFIDRYTEIIQGIIPRLSKLKIVHLSESKYELKIQIDNAWYKLYEMSDGTIKMMILALLLWSPEKINIIALDEPELNNHPAWLKVISKWVLKCSLNTQVFISTHSPDFLDGFTESFTNGDTSLYIFSTAANVKCLTPNKIDSFIKEGWQLGDLYRVGEPLMGGWPW